MITECYKFFYKTFDFCLGFIYPNFCFYCKDFLQDKSVFCQSCKDKIRPVVTTNLEVTNKYKVKIFAISEYKYPIKSLVLAKGGSDIVASRKLGELAWEMTYIKNVDFDFIVPIPLHWKRYAERGFNQAQEMANAISKKSGKPVVNLLKRVKSTQRQSELSPSGRALNVHDAFVLNLDQELKKNYECKKFLIVDDLLTTGSTVKFATKVLIGLKPDSFTAIVACRVI